MSEQKSSDYFIMSSKNPERMLLYSMPDLPDDTEDSWLSGQAFSIEPEQPICVIIQNGFENKQLLPYFDGPPVVSKEFLEALNEAGVDNIIAYDVILESEDESIVYDGFMAINLVGLVKAAGSGAVYTDDTKLIDASIDGLDLDQQLVKGQLMFRLAEDVSTVIVHKKVKGHLESKGFHSLVFTEPGVYVSL